MRNLCWLLSLCFILFCVVYERNYLYFAFCWHAVKVTETRERKKSLTLYCDGLIFHEASRNIFCFSFRNFLFTVMCPALFAFVRGWKRTGRERKKSDAKILRWNKHLSYFRAVPIYWFHWVIKTSEWKRERKIGELFNRRW